jgi:hypothetical protein
LNSQGNRIYIIIYRDNFGSKDEMRDQNHNKFYEGSKKSNTKIKTRQATER